MDHIVSTISLSNHLIALNNLYTGSDWKTDRLARSYLRTIHKTLVGIDPNSWYVSDEEEALIALVGEDLKEFV